VGCDDALQVGCSRFAASGCTCLGAGQCGRGSRGQRRGWGWVIDGRAHRHTALATFLLPKRQSRFARAVTIP